MVKPNIHDVHQRLMHEGIPIFSVQLERDGKSIKLHFLTTASEEQINAAQKIADEWDQEAVDQMKASAFDNLPTADAISSTKSVKELQAMALMLREYVDGHR